MTTARRSWEDDEVALLRENARRFFARECVPNEMRWRAQGRAERAIWNQAGAAGLLCVSIPEAYGGGGGDFRHEAAVTEEQSHAMAGGFSNSVHSGIVAHYILAYGTEAQKQRWLPRMASGELVGAIAMTEPGAGTDLQRIRTRARRTPEGWRISGSKIFITNGWHADLVIVAVKTGDGSDGGDVAGATDGKGGGAKGISLIVVETARAAGFRRGEPLDKIGQKSLDTCELFFDEVLAPEDHLLGGADPANASVGRGFAQLMEQLPRERLIVAVGSVASMRRAIDETLDYVRERKVFGQTLMSMQNTRFKLAECETQAEIARAFVDDCMARLAAGQLDVPTAAMAKWWTTDTCCRIVDDCLQLFGGYGYMNEYPIARLYADVRVGRIYGGTNEVMKEIIARSMDRR
jgi:acyl-CoA dehydrogenase